MSKLPEMSFKQKYKNLKKQWDKLRLKSCQMLIDHKPIASPQPNPNNIKSILFLRQDGKIGDYIVSAFAFREIKKHNPSIQIGVICTDKNQDLFQENIYIDNIHIVKNKSLLNYYQVGKSLSGQYDIVIEPSLFLRPRDLVLLRVLNARFNIGLNKADYQIFNLNIDNLKQHYHDIYAQILAVCGFKNIDDTPELPNTTQSQQAIQLFIEQNQLNNCIALNFFGAANFRRFDEAHIRVILNQLTHTFSQEKFVLLTYPEMTPMLANICQDYQNCFIYQDTKIIQDSIELLRYAKIVVSPDTAIIHIAAALNKKVIGLYQDDERNFANWYPKTENKHIIFFRQHIQEVTADDFQRALQAVCEV